MTVISLLDLSEANRIVVRISEIMDAKHLASLTILSIGMSVIIRMTSAVVISSAGATDRLPLRVPTQTGSFLP